MEQKPAQKFLGVDGHQSLLAAVRIIFPAKRHLTIGNIDNPVIGDGDTMRVAGQIMENMFGSSEWPFGVDDPVIAQRPEKGMESFLFCQRFQIAREMKLSEAERAFETGDELAPKDTAQHFHRQKEWVTGVNPALMVERETTGWDDAVYMRMRLKILPPGVEHAEETDLRPEVFRIGSNLQQRSGTGSEEKIINNLLVL